MKGRDNKQPLFMSTDSLLGRGLNTLQALFDLIFSFQQLNLTGEIQAQRSCDLLKVTEVVNGGVWCFEASHLVHLCVKLLSPS